MALNSIEEILDDLRQGKMVIIMDDEDRENEGDLLMIASLVRPEDINFMARYGRGLICLPMTRERCRQLKLPLMVETTGDQHGTNFTISIEAAEGVTTGISAYDRAHTVRTAVAPNAGSADIVQPGHIFPLMAQPGGVLTRAGHTEAGVDLARLAGFEPAAVIVEVLNEDGSMARRPDLEIIAAEHGLKIGTIEDLIRYRLLNERTVERVADTPVSTEFGTFHLYAYRQLGDTRIHYALARGEIDAECPTLVRVHVTDDLADRVPFVDAPFGWPLRDALRRVGAEGGVVVVLSADEDPQALVRRIRGLTLNAGRGPDEPDGEADLPADLRTHGIGAQILRELGVRRMRLLSAPKRMHGLGGFGLEVVEYVQG
ncbi:bifunctional 3,4-dihydroxy-2-butanone-4-phosphate synthase/GTP cyclohydrolase II [Acidihalobacter ferrooxydans]|uniref:3,4-dihydroxy-2-butanone 4-phosphate synthase n=1 Tax=Acidihalobacter ferrooxydans TaxID=1765967 RepID=A0A1P8UE18_9GAMM|nr:bifunctional 3,4-dihydroxy-2-butanone-4-phosphate synthase/GTP cyclohydrolase II [Acidihalobacter ferrooxydans]APZ42085.1 3,4-dihydroxy-2-butanone-4-phosphate synthase [Acidihalobacter ferrooxydans]